MILTIDEGTTGVRALLIDREGQIRGRGYREFKQYFPQPGRVEHDAIEIWDVTRAVVDIALGEASITPSDIAGIGITNQRETVVVWDRATGTPVHRAIVWQDRRTADLCAELRSRGLEDLVRDRTGLLLDPYFSGTKLTWLFREQPELQTRAEAGELVAGTMDTWLIWNLTAGALHITDPTNASRTLLFDLDKGDWDERLLEIFEVPRAVLPEVRPSSEVYGSTDPAIFGVALPIAGIAGDQQAALFGQGCTTAGLGKNTYGTGAFLLMHTGEHRVRSERGLLTTAACGPRGEYAFALEGSIFIAGAAVQWLRDGLGVIQTAAETEALAESLDGNDGVYFVPAFTGLGAPYWNPDVRGVISGLTRGSTTAHLARAALEAMAYSTSEVADAMEADSGVEMAELRVDGGAAANGWMMQFQSDILGVTVRRPAIIETTAYGAAGLAGLAVGFWKSPEEFQAARRDHTIFEPAMQDGMRESLLAGWRRAIAAARMLTTDAPETT